MFWEYQPCGRYYEILQISNLVKIYRFLSKLVSYGLDEHTSLNKQTH